MGCVIAAVAILALAGWAVTCYKLSDEDAPVWSVDEGCPSNGCLFVLLVVDVYFCFCGALLLPVSAEVIQRGDKIASVALAAGVVLAFVGVLPLLFTVPFVCAICVVCFQCAEDFQ